MDLTEKGLNLIKSYEELRLKAYDDFQPNKILTGKDRKSVV